MRATGGVKSALLMSAICHSACSLQHLYPGVPSWQWLGSFMHENDDVIFFNCGEHFHNVDSATMRNLKHKTTFWSHQEANTLHKLLLGNIAANRRTIAVLPSLSKKDRRCLKFLAHVSRLLFLVDVVILNYVDNILVNQKGTETFRGRKLLCTESFRDSGQKADGHRTVASDNIITFSPRCLAFYTKHLIKKKPSFAGSQVLFGCFSGKTQFGEIPSACKNTEFLLIFEALRAQNATPRLFRYSNVALFFRHLYRGGIDVLLPSTVINEVNAVRYRFPGVLEYRHDTFYAGKGMYSTSFTEVILQSQKMALFMFLTLISSWITFALGHCIHNGKAVSSAAILDFGGCLLAALLSTSAPIPGSQANASRCYLFAFAAWGIVIFPLSFYFRGELTSRLSIVVPPNPIDTLQELEDALDKRELIPCFVGDPSFYVNLENADLSTDPRLYTKIRAASKKQSSGPRCVVSSPTECFRSCASKHNHVCFTHSVADCGPYLLGPHVVKSREPLRLALVTTAVRKDFAMSEAYGNLLSTIFETAINPQGFNNPWNCPPNDSALDDLFGRDETKHVLQFLELSVFFACFSVLLLLSTAVFCAELAFGWKRCTNV